MNESRVPTLAAEQGPPDWETFAPTITCPLCDYNLRGLTEPRCPECGYCFAWGDLTHPKRGWHPYLFEHAKNRYLSAFVRTLTAQINFERFWENLTPSHRVRQGRLAIYWLICAAFAMLPVLMLLALSGADWRRELGHLWTWLRPFPMRFDELVLQMSLFMAVMPLASGLTLQIFQQSMRRARINPVHAWRCGIYAGDTIVWNGIWQAGVVLMMGTSPWGSAQERAMVLMSAGVVVVFIFNVPRLFFAYREYMGFRDPLRTIIASELILILLFGVTTLRYLASALIF